MARTAFESVIELNLEKFGPEAARRKHIEIARRGRAEFLGRQQSKPGVSLIVDGQPASSEEGVKPFGVIIYRFTRMREVARFALEEAIRQSPELSGEYKRSWFAMIDGAAAAVEAIPQNAASFTITNDVPYARKIMVRGARLRGVPPGIVERVRQLVLRRYGAIVTANIEFITLRGGYTLRGNAPLTAAAQNRGSSAFRAGRTHLRARKDTARGRQLTYPALTIAARV